MKLLITIVPSGQSDKVAKTIGKGVIHFQTSVLAKGTAPSEIMEYFSMGDIGKEVLFSLIDDSDIEMIFNALDEEFGFSTSSFGVAFTVETTSIGKTAYNYLYQNLMEVE